MTVRILHAGDQAFLVELENLEKTLQLYEALSAHPISTVHSIVPAARTLLIRFNAFLINPVIVRRWIESSARSTFASGPLGIPNTLSKPIEIPVYYDGEDLAFLAKLLDMPSAEIIRRHTASTYTAAFAGFAPGFVYMTGSDPSFGQIPRRTTPRTRVPARSVALAGNFSAVYPKEGPGGWQLIGTTPVSMWDMSRTEPALIRPGMQVRFVDASRLPLCVTEAPAPEKHADNIVSERPHSAGFQVMSAGVQTLFQDIGRIGQSDRGISCSGALDRQSFHTANRIVGNPSHATVLENAMGALQLHTLECAVVCVTGANVQISVTTDSGQVVSYVRNQAIALNPGDCLRLGSMTSGVRSYIAVRGGWHVPSVLGSSSYDTLADIGPAPLQAGDFLSVGDTFASNLNAISSEGLDPLPSPDLPRVSDCVSLDFLLGPRNDWFSDETISLLTQQPWQVTVQSNRIGLRLKGQAPLTRAPAFTTQELPSEGTVFGALQVPPNGQPILFLADHPLTGGYPVIGCVASYHLDLLGQIPAGSRIRFNIMRDA